MLPLTCWKLLQEATVVAMRGESKELGNICGYSAASSGPFLDIFLQFFFKNIADPKLLSLLPNMLLPHFRNPPTLGKLGANVEPRFGHVSCRALRPFTFVHAWLGQTGLAQAWQVVRLEHRPVFRSC